MTQSVLPSLDGFYDVPPEASEALRRDGHTVLRGVCSDEEVAAYRPVIETAVFENSRETRPLAERDTYGKAFLQVPNIWRWNDDVRSFVLAARFAKIAADLLGVDGVRLYHDQALFKEAGGGKTPWHNDQAYWPLSTDNTVTMWMPLVDVTAEIGSMSFVSGSHRIDLGEYVISDESDEAVDELISDHGLRVDTHGALAAGDATFHVGRILHAAPPNPTGNLRSVMTIIYFEDGATVIGGSGMQEFDRQKWLRGLEPGSPAASDLNPRLWPPR